VLAAVERVEDVGGVPLRPIGVGVSQRTLVLRVCGFGLTQQRSQYLRVQHVSSHGVGSFAVFCADPANPLQSEFQAAIFSVESLRVRPGTKTSPTPARIKNTPAKRAGGNASPNAMALAAIPIGGTSNANGATVAAG
jgi:hypothetical protein